MEVSIISQKHKQYSCEGNVSRLDLYVRLKSIGPETDEVLEINALLFTDLSVYVS